MVTSVEAIAQVCHAANAEYCRTLGDESQKAWEEAPEWQRQSAVKGVEFHLEHLRAGSIPPPSASHESWLKEKQADGWKYGPVKNADTKEHPCFVQYQDLPISQRKKDYIFGAIVKAFYDADMNE